MFRFAIIVCLFAIAGCIQTSALKSSTYEVTGSSTERVDGVLAIITKHQTPPTVLLDAHFVEEQAGDDALGPSDFRAFYFIRVAPQDIARWMQIFQPLGATAEYNAPAQPRDWWISRDTFTSLRFYQPDVLTGKVHGWIGVSQQTGHIYIFSFTM
jgi:hypothetical protein